MVDFSPSASLSEPPSLPPSLPPLLSISLSSVFLEIQVRLTNELVIYLFRFMDSMIDVCAYLSIWFHNSGEYKRLRGHMLYLF